MFPNKMLVFPDYFTVIWGASRFVAGTRRCLQTCRQHSQTCHWHSQACCWHFQALPGMLSALPGLSPAFPGASKVISGAPRYSQTYHNYSHGTPVPVIRDLSYSNGPDSSLLILMYKNSKHQAMTTTITISNSNNGGKHSGFLLLNTGSCQIFN
jgi:hypothetical protein